MRGGAFVTVFGSIFLLGGETEEKTTEELSLGRGRYVLGRGYSGDILRVSF